LSLVFALFHSIKNNNLVLEGTREFYLCNNIEMFHTVKVLWEQISCGKNIFHQTVAITVSRHFAYARLSALATERNGALPDSAKGYVR
jgi:hypothetical protein